MRKPTPLLLLCALLLLACVRSATAGVSVICDPTCVACSGPSPTECTACGPGAYLSAGSCVQCSPIAFCASALTCTSDSSSQCLSCQAGHFLQQGPNDSCPACSPVSNCIGPVTCTSAASSICPACAAGFFPSASGNQCVACAPVDGCLSPSTCTTATTSRCSLCAAGRYLVPGTPTTADTCVICPPVQNCISSVTCSSAGDSQCTQCAPGYALDENGPGDACVPCPSVDHCTAPLGCTSPTTPQCAACALGYHLVDGPADTCVACTPVDHCLGPIACADGNSQCSSCEAGYFLDESGPADACQLCPSIAHCTSSVVCSSATNALCFACESGYYLDASVQPNECRACTPIQHCVSPIACTNATGSVCTQCEPGYHVVAGVPDTCVADDPSPTPSPEITPSPAGPTMTAVATMTDAPTPIATTTLTDVPIAGNRVRFGDLPRKRTNLVISYDRAIDVMNLDPTVTGATLAIAGATPGTSFTLDLPASQWKGPLPGRRFRVTAPGNPKVKVLLVSGRLLRVSLQGSNAYPLGAQQGSVSVTLTIGATRFCTLFGGTISEDDGTRFVARRAPAPAACPTVAPPPNAAPIAQPNAYTVVAGAVTAATFQAGYAIGNVMSDAGPNVDSDPDGDTFTVNAVTNVTLTVAGNPVPLTDLSAGGVWQFSFPSGSGDGLFTVAFNGAFLAVANAGFGLPPLAAGESFVFAFDYTVQDSVTNVSAPAHVTFTITGVDPV